MHLMHIFPSSRSNEHIVPLKHYINLYYYLEKSSRVLRFNTRQYTKTDLHRFFQELSLESRFSTKFSNSLDFLYILTIQIIKYPTSPKNCSSQTDCLYLTRSLSPYENIHPPNLQNKLLFLYSSIN